jgi:two-component system, NtrC family, response regulator AtoC
VPSDFDDIDTGAPEPFETGLCAMISIDGVVTTKRLPAAGDITIGRASTCDLVIRHSSVSRHHATLHVSPLQIIDAGSRNGTRVRGQQLAAGVPTPLSVGEAIQIGSAAILINSPSLSLEGPHLDVAVADRVGPAADVLEVECARSARSGSQFAVLRLQVPEGQAHEVNACLRAIVRTTDVVSTEDAGTFLVVLVETTAQQAQLAVARMQQLLRQRNLVAAVGIARYPLDGVTAEQLDAHAWERLARSPDAPATKMDEVRALVAQVAKGELSVLITGETGVGKELFAEMIHRQSARANKPFVKLNCSALVETLIESELFGHERGAFTGATASHPGLLETGHGGTVFLDEIGELPLGVQAKLLRVLEERVVRRVGATTGKTLDVRFMCATNRELEDAVEAGTFRRDLYYRINAVTVSVPPLRARLSEIGGLARAFARRARGASIALSGEVIATLERHPWPGNIRELRNTIERAALLSSGGTIRPSHLALDTRRSDPSITMPMPIVRATPEDQLLARAVADLERQRIVEALEACSGNQTRAARMLGISRTTLVARLDAYGLPRPRKS